MAEKKKVYSIVINGLQESLDAVKSLNEQFKELDGLISTIGERTIKVKGEVDVTNLPDGNGKTVVSGGNGISTSVEEEKNLAIQKQLTQEIKEQGRLQAALDEQYREGQRTIQQTKQDAKNLLSGAIDEAGNFTNTLAGWKAELKALKAEREGLNLTDENDVRRFKEIQERANALTTILKQVESETGNFSRNVGNYPQNVESLNRELLTTQRTIDAITKEIDSGVSGDRLSKLTSELDISKRRADELKSKIQEVGEQINSIPKVDVNVGGVVRQFSSMREAARQLREEYAQLVAEGKEGTKEANDLAEAYGRVATATKNATGELRSYIGGTKGLNDAISIMRGVASIGSIGMGISGLFGDKDSDVSQNINKLMSLSMIMSGLTKLQQDMNDKTSKWGQILAGVWAMAGKGIDWISEKSGLSKGIDYITKGFEKFGAEAARVYEQFSKFDSIGSNFVKLADNLRLSDESMKLLIKQYPTYLEIVKTLKDAASDPSKFKDGIVPDDINKQISVLETNIRGTEEVLSGLSESGDETAKSMLSLSHEMKDCNFSTKGLSDSNKELLTGMISGEKGAIRYGKAMSYLSSAITKVAAAFKAFVKATLIIAALQLAMEAITWTLEKLGDVWRTIKGEGGLKLEDRMKAAEENTKLADDALQKYIEHLEYLKNIGVISELQMQGLAFMELDKAIQKAGKDLQDFIKKQDGIKSQPIEKNLNPSSIYGLNDAFGNYDVKNLDEFVYEYNALIKAVEEGTDKIEAGGKKGYGWLLTSSDAVEELGDRTKVILGQMQSEINKINFDDPEQAVKDFRKISDNELYKSALAQMHTLFPEEEWAKTLDRMYNRLSDFVDKSEKRAKDLAVAMKNANKQLEEQAELSRINAIKNADERQKALDDYNKRKRQEEINKSVADEEHKQKALEALDEEYKTKAEEREKTRIQNVRSKSDEEYNIVKQIRTNLLELEKNNLDKQLEQLENEKQDELRTAERATKHREELIESIEKKYQKKAEDLRTEWYKKTTKQQKEFDRELIRMAQETADELNDIRNTAAQNEISRNIDNLENIHTRRTESITYDYTESGANTFEESDRQLESTRKHNRELLDEQIKYIEEKQRLEIQEINESERIQKEHADKEYAQRTSSLEQWLEEQKEMLETQYREGEITDEEYQKNIQKLEDTYRKSSEEAELTHQAKLTEAIRNAEQERLNVISQSETAKKNEREKAYQNEIAALNSHLESVRHISDRQERANTNQTTGIFNLKAERERLNNLKSEYETSLDEIHVMIKNVQSDEKNGIITPEQAKATKDSLDKQKNEIEDSLSDIASKSDKLTQDFFDKVNSYASKIASQFNQLASSAFNIWNAMLDGEQNRIDEEQKMLDKETDMLEKAYDKQLDIVQRYKDAINNTEDELKTARGERRQALLDGLAEQREGYLKETETLNKQELEKEKIAKKEEKLQKQQEELDKKRKKLQQVQSIVQAMINTSLGVTQALAAWPPPYSFILAGAVAAMGAAEIAVISSQKYAKGGQLSGPSHAEGGIKVPTKKGFAEVEGDEYIVNKKTTVENLSLIEYVNSKKRRMTLDDFIEFYSGKAHYTKTAGSSLKFADGGILPDMTDFSSLAQQTPVIVDLNLDSKVSVVDILSAADNVTKTRVLAGL